MVNRWRLDSGVSLVEVVVAMFVLALLSLALIPALIASIKQSAANTLLSSATQIVSARLDEARVQSATCSSLTALVAANVPDVIDSSGITLHVNQKLGNCPSSYPGTVPITVAVSRTDTAAVLVTATTLVFLQSVN